MVGNVYHEASDEFGIDGVGRDISGNQGLHIGGRSTVGGILDENITCVPRCGTCAAIPLEVA